MISGLKLHTSVVMSCHCK